MSERQTIIGQRVRRREDPRFLTGAGRYVDDVPLEGSLHAVFVRSPWAHAEIRSVDITGAASLDGVRAFTAADIGIGPIAPLPMLSLDERFARPPVASRKVRFAGEIVAVVVADTRERATDAAELVEVEYEPLPALTDAVTALRDEVLLFAEVGSNVCARQTPAQADPQLIDRCEVSASGTLVSQRIAAAPIEPRATAARVGEDGRITVWLSTQTPHGDRDGLASALGVDPQAVRVIAPDVGGGFGGKGLDVEDILVAWLARAIGRPVRWTETRSENLVAMHHGRAQRIEFEIGGRRDGTAQALRLRILQDAGAYPGIGAFLPQFTKMMASGVYAFEAIEVEVQAVLTTTTPTGAVRGAGRPEATQVVERAIDAFARECALDPAEVRRRSFIPAGSFPFTTRAGAVYDSGDYAEALDRVLAAAGYERLRTEQAERRRAGVRRELGIGLSSYVEITNGINETEFGAVEITPDGGAVLRTGSFSQGQGHETTFAQIVAERLGLPLERITVLKGDTDQIAFGTGTYGSKSTQIGGGAAASAAEQVVERARELAASELEASPEDMRLDLERGRFHVAGTPEPSLAWSELAGRLEDQGRLAELRIETEFSAAPTFPFGAHLALVEVDVETGKVTLQRIVALDDAGPIINPLIAEGQVHGGLAAGIAQALYEQLAYDEDGNPQNSNFVNYAMPSAADLPSFELLHMQTPSPLNPLGVKGIGESGTIGSTAAVHGAVLDALAPRGVREIEMPATDERVWRALRDAGSAGA
jgi:carbon-monoxide dehydrogenase large subunit